jgi:hypothetical protein
MFLVAKSSSVHLLMWFVLYNPKYIRQNIRELAIYSDQYMDDKGINQSFGDREREREK